MKENKGKPVKQCKLTSQVKKTKQKEEKYKNTHKMRDVRLTKKIIIIIQIYNNFQVLWSSKVKFVSLSPLLRCPSLSPTLVFSQFQVLMSHSWGFKKERKKMTEGRRDIKGKKEGKRGRRY